MKGGDLVISVRGIGAAKAVGDAFFKNARLTAENGTKKMATHIFKEVLATSPQYSGTFVANWKLSINGVDTGWNVNPLGTKGFGPSYQEGDMPGQTYAMSQLENMSEFKLGSSITISNSTMGQDGDVITPLAIRIEDNAIKFRDVNVSGGHTLSRAVASVQHRMWF